MKPTRFVILGGGTAGWMAATLFERAFPGASVTLAESSAIGTIGVGEGSTPAFKSFMDAIGIAEQEWMPACQATYKSGIRFADWSRLPGFGDYFHPFLSQFDRDHIKALSYNAALRRGAIDAHAHPDLFCFSHYLAARGLCPRTTESFPFEVQYGYHFNAGLLARLLKDTAISRGVIWKDCAIERVLQDDAGDIAALHTADGEIIDGDFFVDCSGFASLITQETLGVPFHSYADALFNDRAVTLPLEIDTSGETQTLSTALSAGWTWRIPQKGRVGHGYVYSSRHISDEDAAAELVRHAAPDNGVDPASLRHIPFRTGRAESVWNRNSLAVGLSQGFLEPLEATALALVQLTLARFVRYYAETGDNRHAARLNGEVAAAFDGVKDYIHTHFVTSSRDDSAYWRECRANGAAVSPRLRQVLECWFKGGDLRLTLAETGLDRHYKFNSWLYILSGMGIFPQGDRLQPLPSAEARLVPTAEIAAFFERCALNFMPQPKALARLASGQSVFPECDRFEPSQIEALQALSGSDFGVSATG